MGKPPLFCMSKAHMADLKHFICLFVYLFSILQYEKPVLEDILE